MTNNGRFARQEDEKIIQELARCDDHAAAVARTIEITSRRIELTGCGLNLTEAHLTGLDLREFDLRQCTLNRADLHSTNLSGANLQGASLVCPGMERTNLSHANLSGTYFHALAAQNANFNGADFSDAVDGTGTLFHGCSMRNIRAANAVLAGATFYQCDLQGADLRNMNLQGATVNECIVEQADFSGALVSQLTFTKCMMRNARFHAATGRGLTLQTPTCADGLHLSGADLPMLRCDQMLGVGIEGIKLNAPGADFQSCSLRELNFSEANLSRSRWLECTIEQGTLSSAKLEGAFFSHCRLPKLAFDHVRAENIHFVETQLANADMRGFAARCAFFRDCNLEHADLTGAYLYRAMLTGDPPRAMSLRGAKLNRAVLTQSYIAADLEGANLRGAIAAYARLNQCSMQNADLSGINAFEASMVKVDVTGATLAGLGPPIFISRCPGLSESLKDRDDHSSRELGLFVEGMENLRNGGRKGST